MFIALAATAAVKDTPFKQDVAVRIVHQPEVQGAVYRRLLVDRDDVAYVLTDRGVARLFDTTLSLDRSYRPLAGQRARDLSLGRGWVHYLFDDRWLSNGDNGRPLGHLSNGVFDHLAVAEDGAVLLAARDRLNLFRDGKLTDVHVPAPTGDAQVFCERSHR